MNFIKNKKSIVIVAVVVLAVAVFGVWLGFYLNKSENPDALSGYSAVYLQSGEIYFGKLSWLPWPHLNDVWLLQSGGQNFGIIPFNSSVWGPAGKIYLNPKQIIFWTGLKNSSPVVKALKNPSAFQAPAASQNQNSNVPSETFRGPSAPPPTK